MTRRPGHRGWRGLALLGAVALGIGPITFGLLVVAVLIGRRIIRKRRESSRTQVGST